MQIILLRGRVDEKMVDDLIEALTFEDNDKTIYFCSTGGVSQSARLIVDIINNHPSNITLVGYADLQSSGFDIFYYVTKPKRILPGCIGMVHMTRVDIEIDEKARPYYPEDKARVDYMKTFHFNESQAMVNSLGLSSKDLKKFMAGEPIYLQPEKMLEIFGEKKG